MLFAIYRRGSTSSATTGSFSFKYLSLSSETVSCLTLCLRRNSQHLPCNQNLSALSQSRPLCCVCLGKHHRLHFVQWSINTFSSTSVVKMWQVTDRKLGKVVFQGLCSKDSSKVLKSSKEEPLKWFLEK